MTTQPQRTPPYARPARDLTPTAAIAFAVGVLLTLSTAALAVVVGPALEDPDDVVLNGVLALAGLLTYLLLIGAWIAGSLWLHQARANSELLAPGYDHARSPVWAWLGWWVPVVSLWFPYQLVRDVQVSVTRWSSPLIGWWWALWLTYLLWDRIAGAVIDAAAAGDASPGTAQAVTAIGAVLCAAALVAWGMVLRAVTTTQARAGRGEPVALWERPARG